LPEKFVASLPRHGEELGSDLFGLIQSDSKLRLTAVTGYVGNETIRQLIQHVGSFPSVGVALVVGMAAKEGLSERTYNSLGELSDLLIQSRDKSNFAKSNVYFYFSGPRGERGRGLHAKAYRVVGSGVDELIVGSSNFSRSGLSPRGNVEASLWAGSNETKQDFDSFFDELLNDGQSFVPYEKVLDFPLKGKSAQKARGRVGLLRVASPQNFKGFPFVDLDLGKNIDSKTRSNLNVCFGRGRWSRGTGIVRPRDYFEAEIIVPNETNSLPDYPVGDFLATTSDGFRFEARTQGDYNKNLRSKQDLGSLGLWIKSLLDSAGALDVANQEAVTSETFENYGNSILRIYRDGPKSAILHFPSNPKEL